MKLFFEEKFFKTIAHNGLQISEGTNSVGIVRLDLGFCLSAVSSSAFLELK